MSSWIDEINDQLERMKSAGSATAVLEIVGAAAGSDEGFFDGSEESLLDALTKAGWRVVWSRAAYNWKAQAPDGSRLICVEGDLYAEHVGSGSGLYRPESAPKYAAKFAAATVSYEPPRWEEPTDEAFRRRFAHCVCVPDARMYPLIREAFEREYAEKISAAKAAMGTEG